MTNLPHRPDPADERYCLACGRSIAGTFSDGTYGPTASGADPCGWHVPQDFAGPDLAEWLLAAIADDEQVARTTLRDLVDGGDGTRWLPAVEAVVVEETSEVIARTNVDDDKIVRHIARWDPKRVLDECDARRRILEVHCVYDWPGSSSRHCMGCGFGSDEEPRTADINDCPVLQALALPLVDRPGYKEEWRPSP